MAGDSQSGLPGAPANNGRACKYVVNTAMTILNLPQLASAASDSLLLSLFSVLIACIIDERLRLVQDGEGLLRAINMIITKLLENAPKCVAGRVARVATCSASQRVWGGVP